MDDDVVCVLCGEKCVILLLIVSCLHMHTCTRAALQLMIASSAANRHLNGSHNDVECLLENGY